VQSIYFTGVGVSARVGATARRKMPRVRTVQSKSIDKKIGEAIRKRRLELALSQAALADRLQISFQQVQKYELGNNRVACSTLIAIAQALNTKPLHLLEDATQAVAALSPAQEAEVMLVTQQILSITSPAVRGRILALIKDLADEDSRRVSAQTPGRD
jgi:transcriptional regulator with XRE-family HTH domain